MKVISFSLWGDKELYTIGAIKNADLAKKIYPGWICRFYCGKSVPSHIIQKLSRKENTEIFILNEQGNWTGMFWRFCAASDPLVDVMISRDTDSRLTVREKAAVDEWLESNKDFHIMRDHPYHGVPVLGGMWGARNGIVKNMSSLIQDYIKGNFWQVDQNFLKDRIYESIKENAFVHDEFFEKKPFPVPRSGREFIGQQFDENDKELHPEHSEIIK